MKKLIITTAVMLMAALVSSQAKAELALVTTNGGSFNYDPANASVDSLNVGSLIGDNGLNDFAVFLGYRNTGDGTFEAPIELTNGTVVAGSTSARGAVDFGTVTFGNGVSVDALATFRLEDTTAAIGDPSASLLYDLELSTSGIPVEPGALLSLAGFDFNNNFNSDRLQGQEAISDFDNSQIAIGDVNTPVERVLAGRSVFDDFTDEGRTIAFNNNRRDSFNGTIADNLDSLTGFTPPTVVNGDGDLGFAFFSDFQEVSADDTFVTAGVVQFRSTVAANAVAGVPEPSTLLMASMGLGMVAFRRRRKQKA